MFLVSSSRWIFVFIDPPELSSRPLPNRVARHLIRLFVFGPARLIKFFMAGVEHDSFFVIHQPAFFLTLEVCVFFRAQVYGR